MCVPKMPAEENVTFTAFKAVNFILGPKRVISVGGN